MKRDVWYAGRVVGTENVYDSALLMFLLRAHRPRVYRDNVAVEHSGGMEVTGDRKVTFEFVRPSSRPARSPSSQPRSSTPAHWRSSQPRKPRAKQRRHHDHAMCSWMSMTI